jgi:hypothetical protein
VLGEDIRAQVSQDETPVSESEVGFVSLLVPVSPLELASLARNLSTPSCRLRALAPSLKQGVSVVSEFLEERLDNG